MLARVDAHFYQLTAQLVGVRRAQFRKLSLLLFGETVGTFFLELRNLVGECKRLAVQAWIIGGGAVANNELRELVGCLLTFPQNAKVIFERLHAGFRLSCGMKHGVESVGINAPLLEVTQGVVELLTGCKRIGFVNLLVGCKRLVLLCLGFVGVNLATAHTLSKSAHKLAMRCRALFIELREDAHTVVCRFGRCLANVGRWRTAARRIEPERFAATLGQRF